MVMKGVEDTISCAFDTAAETVVVSFVVVVAHVVSGGSIGGTDFFLGDFDVLVGNLATIFDFVSRVCAAAIFTLGDVELGLVGLVSNVVSVDFDVYSVIFCWTVVPR